MKAFTLPKFPPHPDLIPGLEGNCRRVLRNDYMAIQAAAQWYPRGCILSTLTPRQRDDVEAQQRARVTDRIAEYRRTAALWGVEVPS